MSYFQKVLNSESFLAWLEKWNLFADAANPAGSGTVEFNNVLVNGAISFGSAATSVSFPIDTYDYDMITPPKTRKVRNRFCSEFSGSKTCAVWLSFDMSQSKVAGADRKIGIGYSIESTGTGNSYWKMSYWVNKPGVGSVSVASGTAFSTIEVTGTSAAYFYNNSVTIPQAAIGNAAYTALVKLERIGANVLDTYNECVYVFDFKIE